MSKNKEAWDWLKRFGTKDQKDLFRPVYSYIQQLEKRIAELELMHDKHMAPQMFAKPLTDKELLVQLQIEKTRKMLDSPIQRWPLKERLQNMIDENKVDSDEWNKTLKWNRLTNQAAFDIVNKNEKL